MEKSTFTTLEKLTLHLAQKFSPAKLGDVGVSELRVRESPGKERERERREKE